MIKKWVNIDLDKSNFSKEKQIGSAAVDYINSINADLVITGSRNLSGLKKAMIGSVSSYVLKRINCPIVIHKTLVDSGRRSLIPREDVATGLTCVDKHVNCEDFAKMELTDNSMTYRNDNSKDRHGSVRTYKSSSSSTSS